MRFLIKMLKAIAFLVFSLCFVLLLAGGIIALFFIPKDPVIDSLPKYEKKESYSDNGFQDVTSYAKFTYQIGQSELEQSGVLSPVTNEDISVILRYVQDFEGVVDHNSDFPGESYDFDKSMISVGDFFRIINRHEEPEKAFWNYDVYYFDLDTSILYFIHTNI